MVDQIRMTQEFIHKVFKSEILSGFLGTVPVEDCQVCNHAHHEDYLVDKLVVVAMGGGREGEGDRRRSERKEESRRDGQMKRID